MPVELCCIRLLGPLPYLWLVRGPVFVDFVWHNINKFTTSFKLFKARCVLGLTAWEQTKVIDILFLCCLQVAVGSHNYSRQTAL